MDKLLNQGNALQLVGHTLAVEQLTHNLTHQGPLGEIDEHSTAAIFCWDNLLIRIAFVEEHCVARQSEKDEQLIDGHACAVFTAESQQNG